MTNLDETQELRALLDIVLDGKPTEQRLARLDELICGNADARRYYAQHVTMVAELEREIGQLSGATVPGSRGFRLRSLPTYVVAASLALVVGALIAGISFLRPSGDPAIAKIVGHRVNYSQASAKQQSSSSLVGSAPHSSGPGSGGSGPLLKP